MIGVRFSNYPGTLWHNLISDIKFKSASCPLLPALLQALLQIMARVGSPSFRLNVHTSGATQKLFLLKDTCGCRKVLIYLSVPSSEVSIETMTSHLPHHYFVSLFPSGICEMKWAHHLIENFYASCWRCVSQRHDSVRIWCQPKGNAACKWVVSRWCNLELLVPLNLINPVILQSL